MKHLLLLTLCASLLGCSKEGEAPTAAALEPAADAACSLDGMTLSDYPGPKGQIRYVDGKVDYFCDTVEVLSELLAPEQVRSLAGAYVQDMAQADWSKPKGYWIEAKSAFYVAGSQREGSMGPTLASFAARGAAEKFVSEQGGKIYTFKEITPQMVKLDGGVIKDEGM